MANRPSLTAYANAEPVLDQGEEDSARLGAVAEVPLKTRGGRRVLVLGAGFIGASVVRALLDCGHTVTALTRSAPVPQRKRLLEGCSVVVSEPPWHEALPGLLADAEDLIYCVGSSTPIESEVGPADDISAVLPPLVHLLELVKLHPATRLTFISSGGTVYGNVSSLPISEDAPTRPISSYGILKLACEHYIGMYTDVHGIASRILRVTNPYGPTQDDAHGQGLIARLFKCARTGEPVTLVDWGRAIRDYVHVDDLALAVVRSVESDELPAVINLGSGVGHTSRQVANMVCEIAGRPLEVRLAPPRGYDVKANVVNIARAQRYLGVEPRSLRQGLEETWGLLTAQMDLRDVSDYRRARGGTGA